jgi:hypothetical protein
MPLATSSVANVASLSGGMEGTVVCVCVCVCVCVSLLQDETEDKESP